MKTSLKKRLLAASLFIAGAISLSAQNVTNVDFWQEGDSVKISYELDWQADIEVKVSTDGGKTFSSPLTHVTGGVGYSVNPGKHTIVWDVLSERDKLVGDSICFLVSATSSTNNFYESPNVYQPQTYVENNVKTSKQTSTNYQAYRHRLSAKEWWNKHFQAGFNIGLGLGEMTDNDDGYDEIIAGFNFRFCFGPVAFIFGANYQYNGSGYINTDDDGEVDSEFSTISHQIVPRAGIQIGRSDKASLYAACFVEQGITLSASSDYKLSPEGYCNKTTTSVVPRLGWNNRHHDIALYYRLYLSGKNIFTTEANQALWSETNPDNKRIGIVYSYKF